MRALAFFLLLVALGLSWWALHYSKTLNQAEGHQQQHIAYFVDDLDYQVFNARGQLQKRLLAHNLQHDAQANIDYLDGIQLTIFTNQQKRWHAQAQHAIVYHDEGRLRLHEQAQIQYFPDPPEPPLRLASETLDLYEANHYLETDQAVQLTQGGHWIHAVGLRAWLQAPIRIQFLHQTRAYYVVE